MFAPAAIVTLRGDRRLRLAVLLGVALSAALGVGATSGSATRLLAALGLIGFLLGALALYRRDPVAAFIGLWLFEVFNAPLSAAAGYFSPTGEAIRQADEVLVVGFLILTLARAARTSQRLPRPYVLLAPLGFAVCGLLGAAQHGVPSTVALIGGWLALKLWLALIIALLLPWRRSDAQRVYRVLIAVGGLVAVIGLLDYLTHAAISRALHTSIYEFRAGAARGEAVHSIFPHPGEFSLFMSLLFALTFARFAARRSRRDLLLALCFAGSVMLSLRLKGFLSIAAVVAVVGLVQAAHGGRRGLAIAAVGTLLLGGIYLAEASVISKQIQTYTSSESSARAKLYSTGARIASDDLPLGAGFGRFGSYASRLYYSPVYQQFGLSRVWGLSREFPNFIDDTSWPAIIGESGYGGLAFYVFGLLCLIAALLRGLRARAPAPRWLTLAALCALAAFLVDSAGDPTLFDWLASTCIALLAGPALAPAEALEPALREATEPHTPVQLGPSRVGPRMRQEPQLTAWSERPRLSGSPSAST